MKQNLIAACLQTSAGPVIEDNLASIAPMIAEARNMGADLIVLPETCDFRTGDRAKQFSTARDEDSHPAITFFSNAARQQGAWILAGSLIIKTTHDRLANRSFLFAPDGGIAARYDKIHRFDADLGKDAVYHESASFQAGDKAVLAEAGETPGIIAAKLDLEQVADARRMVPSLQHDREFRLQS